LIRQFQSLEAVAPKISSAWKETALIFPNLGTPGKFRLACSATSGASRGMGN
jgi:hypothetical protein